MLSPSDASSSHPRAGLEAEAGPAPFPRKPQLGSPEARLLGPAFGGWGVQDILCRTFEASGVLCAGRGFSVWIYFTMDVKSLAVIDYSYR